MQLLIVLELEWEQIIVELWSKSLAEQLLLVCVICHLASGIASKTVELTSIGMDVHASLGKMSHPNFGMPEKHSCQEVKNQGQQKLFEILDN